MMLQVIILQNYITKHATKNVLINSKKWFVIKTLYQGYYSATKAQILRKSVDNKKHSKFSSKILQIPVPEI